MGTSIAVNNANFETEVVEASFQKPVLVDFFATWCGPCQLLKPLLEKLTQEYNFTLAKVDIDQNPELASLYNVEGVPDVRVVSQGKIMPGFVGVLSEPQLRQFLTQLNLQSELELGLEAIQQAKAEGNLKQVKQLFDQLFAQFPNSPQLVLEAAQFLIKLKRLEDATQMLSTLQESHQIYFSQAQALKGLIQFQQDASIGSESELDGPFAQACNFALNEDYEQALQLFLEIVGKSRQYKNDGARKALLMIFDLLGNEHPLTQQYRKQLLSQLY